MISVDYTKKIIKLLDITVLGEKWEKLWKFLTNKTEIK